MAFAPDRYTGDYTEIGGVEKEAVADIMGHRTQTQAGGRARHQRYRVANACTHQSKRTAAAASAASNAGSGLKSAIDRLGALFGQGSNADGTTNLNSVAPVTFNAETYTKAKPLFEAAIADMGDAAKDLKAVMRTVVRMVLNKFGAQAAANMKPYVVRFLEGSA